MRAILGTWKLWLSLSLAGFCGGEAAVGMDRESLRFYLSFEDGLQPSIAGANSQLQFVKGEAKDAQLVEGRRGRGLKVTPSLCLQYKTRDSFAPKEGTISFWMKPVGWSGVGSVHHFLVLQSDRAALDFYIYPGNPWIYIVDSSSRNQLIGGSNWQSAFGKEPFAEGQWVFFAYTFKPGQQAFYINNKLITRNTEGLIEPEFTSTGILEIPLGSEEVLDEIMVFDRVLTEQEIAAVYQANTP